METCVYSEDNSAAPQPPSVSNKPMPTSVFKRFGKKPYTIIGIIAIVIIAVALLVPQGAATISLNVS